MSTPPSTGPRIVVAVRLPSNSEVACATTPSSSPSRSGISVPRAEPYGALKRPTQKTTASSSGNDSAPVQWSTGTAAISGARATSQTSIVRRDPSFVTSDPAGIPKSPIGTISAASTAPIRAAEPVVTSTNQGSARNVICVPVVEISCAARRARTAACLSMGRIVRRLYGFVKCDGAEGQRGPPRAPPRADPRRRAQRVRPLGLPGHDGRPARGGDRPLARHDLPLLPEQVGALLGAGDARPEPRAGGVRRRRP